jgi:mannose-6-phosphate isomerase-like protein (cupin superfamily)
MKRNTFLRLFAAAGALFTSGMSASGEAIRVGRGKMRAGAGVRVANGRDRNDEPIHLFEGDTFFTKIATKDTDGDLFAFESTRQSKGGPALHYHLEQDEWFYVLSGEFLVKVGEETFSAKAGDCVLAPRTVPHTFSKVSEGEAKMMIVYQPAGKMETYFKAISQGVLKNMSADEVAKYKREHGTVVVGPALDHLKQ